MPNNRNINNLHPLIKKSPIMAISKFLIIGTNYHIYKFMPNIRLKILAKLCS